MSIEKSLELEIAQMEKRLLGNPTSADVAPEVVEEQEEKLETQPESAPTELANKVEDAPTEDKTSTDWEKRFKNFKAVSDATNHKQRQEIITLTESNVKLSKEKEELRRELQTIKESNSSSSVYDNLFSEEEKDIVGEDTLATMKKATQAAVQAAVKPLQEALEEERSYRLRNTEQRAQEVTYEHINAFTRRLEELSPVYQKYDTDPKFISWMSEPDEVSGIVRSILFKNSQNIGDASGVAKFFNEYHSIVTENTKVLESNITPSKSGSSTPVKEKNNNSGEVPITRAFIDRFYEDCLKGRYKGKEKLRVETERKIDQFIAGGFK